MESDGAPETSAVPDLQNVLTRYVDSHEGYHQAAELMEEPHLAGAFKEIATRRAEVARKLSGLIRKEDELPETGGSREGDLHRWWMRLRDQLTDDDLKAVLLECIRGERVLAGALADVLKSPDLNPEHLAVLRDAHREVETAIADFSSAVEV